MQKKSLLLGLAALVLAMTFIGCDNGLSNPDSITNIENAQALSGPANLSAKAYRGVNLITWDVHKDAKSYTVYRKDTVTGITKLLKGDQDNPLDPEETRYIDATTLSEPLVNGREYTYTVIANSGKSPVTRSLDQNSIIHDGASSVKVKANIPEIGTPVTMPAATDITIENKTIDGADVFIVKWTDKEEFFNNYSVGYVYEATPTEFESLYDVDTALADSGEVSQYLDREKYVFLPAIGGKLTFRVTGSFYNEDNDGFGYYTTASVEKAYDQGATTVLPEVDDFQAYRDGSNVKLEWSNVENATGYAIYKAKAKKDSDDKTKIIGAWTKVTPSSQVQGADKWSALEEKVDTSTNYKYLIIATAGTEGTPIRSRSPATASISDTTITNPNLAVAAYWNPTTQADSVAISWNAQTGATYKLERAEATQVGKDKNNAPILVAIAAYTTLELASDKAASYADETAIKRHSYIYKLTITYNGETKQYEKNMATEPFSATVSAAQLTVEPSTNNVNAITVAFEASPTQKNHDLSAELYRQETTSEGKLIGKAIKINTADLPVGYEFEDTGLEAGKYYMYSMLLKSSSEKADMTDTKDKLYGSNNKGVAPSSAGEQFSQKFTATVNPDEVASGTDTHFVYSENTGENNSAPLLKGAALYKMTRSATSQDKLSNAMFSWTGKTTAGSINYKSAAAALAAPLANVNQYDTYFSVSATTTTPAGTYAEDIYFVLGSNGLPYNINGNSGTYSGSISAVKISRIAGSPPSASITTIPSGSILWQ
ncbi:MAG: hypothetical protein LBD79_09155 [Treponema sp.]|jgi:hypothetical protein|nr:hypothetical protein [Treponema sp.]